MRRRQPLPVASVESFRPPGFSQPIEGAVRLSVGPVFRLAFATGHIRGFSLARAQDPHRSTLPNLKFGSRLGTSDGLWTLPILNRTD